MNRILFSVLFLILSLIADGQQWKNYTAADEFNCFAFDHDTIWIGTDGGVVKCLMDGTFLAFYNKIDGLAADYIISLAIDSQGNKWFGTGNSYLENNANGVSKFDGRTWVTYNPYNSGLADNQIFSIKVDKKGNLWFTSVNNVYKFDNVSWYSYSSIDSELINGYPSIIDSHGNDWYCEYNGLIEFDGTSLNFYPFPSFTSNFGNVEACAIDRHDNFWIGWEYSYPPTQNGLAKFDGTNWYNYSDSVDERPVTTILVDTNDNLWLNSVENCIYEYGKNGFVSYCDSSIPSIIGTAAVDNQNRLWFIASENANYQSNEILGWFDGTNWFSFVVSNNSPLNSNYVVGLGADAHNNIWIAPYSSGNKIDNNIWSPNDCTGGGPICIDDLGNVWTAAIDVTKFDGTNCFFYSNGIFLGGITYIAIDQQQIAWCINTGSNCITTFDGNTWTSVLQDPIVSNDYGLTQVAVDKKNNKWFGTINGGVVKFDGTNWINYNTSNSGLPDSSINCIVTDNNGNVWFGTELGGVAKFDGTNWTVYNTSNSPLPGNWINTIATDKKGNLWVSCDAVGWSSPTGLTEFDGTNWITYTSTNSGLSDNYVTCMAFDTQNNGWFGTYAEGISELLNTDSTFAAWLQFTGNICSDSVITLNADINSGHPPYNYAWQSSGNSLSCYNCQNPTASITQNSTFIVQVTDSTNVTVSDTLVVYACVATDIKQVAGNNASLSVYPNPFSSNISVNLQLQNSRQTTFTITNMLGQTVYSKQANNLNSNYSNTLDLSSLPNGIYFFQVVSDNENSVKEIVKQ